MVKINSQMIENKTALREKKKKKSSIFHRNEISVTFCVETF